MRGRCTKGQHERRALENFLAKSVNCKMSSQSSFRHVAAATYVGDCIVLED
jgi:hypothetical protein